MNPKRSTAQVVSAIFGFMMMAISTPCVLAMLNDLLIVGTDNSTGALIVGTFMGFVGIAGLVMVVFGLRAPKAQASGPIEHTTESSLKQALHHVDGEADSASHDAEREVLEIARNHDGRLTVADLAVDSDLSVGESKRLLDYMVRCEVAQTHLTDSGNIVYVFPGFATNKMAAINPLDDLAVFDRELSRSEEDVVLDRGMDGNVAFDLEAEEEEEVAAVQPQTESEKW